MESGKKFKIHVKKDDVVRMLVGNDRGKSGKVLKVFPETSRVIVEGVGEAAQEQKVLDIVKGELELISGQGAEVRRSKKSISNFKLRENQPIGCRVTLRRSRMYEFMDKLVSLALPRVRDFKGVSDSGFDGRGNYSMGIREQIIFPEIDIDKINKVSGMDITFVTTAKTDEESYELLKELGVPFKKNK
ncbi:hypothetical protein CHS0354_023757 [Potamilus streckersoni]|uniref:KOW domain-containing protein n=1 Tax=Potamilus streckersoni TaxID=2493646 RepID=A0AAE0RZ14_9BIVA|nr:hypothetical protein CHS0354_023757 [Potamilus streckersoni]